MTATVLQTVQILETEIRSSVAFRVSRSVISASIRRRNARTFSIAIIPVLIRVAGVVIQHRENAAVIYLL